MRRQCCLWIFKSFFFISVMALPYVAKSFFITEQVPNGIIDVFQDWSAEANKGVKPEGVLTLQVIISLLSDIFYLFNWGYWVLFIHNSRMPLAWCGVLIIFTLSQFCWDIKAPENIKWEELNFPSLLLPFKKTTAVFFSLDIAFFNLANLEWHRRGIKWLWMLGTALGAAVGIVLVILRRNYSIGVIFGAITAHYCYIIARKVDSALDARIERCCRCRRGSSGETNHSEEIFSERPSFRKEENSSSKEQGKDVVLFE